MLHLFTHMLLFAQVTGRAFANAPYPPAGAHRAAPSLFLHRIEVPLQHLPLKIAPRLIGTDAGKADSNLDRLSGSRCRVGDISDVVAADLRFVAELAVL